jgi:hypothetical protein
VIRPAVLLGAPVPSGVGLSAAKLGSPAVLRLRSARALDSIGACLRIEGEGDLAVLRSTGLDHRDKDAADQGADGYGQHRREERHGAIDAALSGLIADLCKVQQHAVEPARLLSDRDEAQREIGEYSSALQRLRQAPPFLDVLCRLGDGAADGPARDDRGGDIECRQQGDAIVEQCAEGACEQGRARLPDEAADARRPQCDAVDHGSHRRPSHQCPETHGDRDRSDRHRESMNQVVLEHSVRSATLPLYSDGARK